MSSSKTSLGDNVLGETDDSPPTMEVQSSVVEPIIVTDTQARWVLENKGILSRDSVIQVQLIVPAGTEGFLPVGAGIYSLIKSATLRIGARRINSIQDLAFFKSMTHSYDTPSYRTNVTRILKGINTTLVPTNSAPTAVAGGQFVFAGGVLGDGGEGAQGMDYQTTIRSGETLTPSFSLKLSDLFPVLEDIELPLFLLKDEVAIDLTFRTQTATDGPGGVGTICCFPQGAAGPVLGTCKIDKPSLLLFQDTIYYSNERMEEVAMAVNAKEGLYLNYTDVIQNVAALPALPPINTGTETEMSTSQKVNQVPLSGFRVKNLFWCYNVVDWQPKTIPATAYANYRYYNPFMGKYAMSAYLKDDTWNVRCNDLLLFPQPVTSATLKAAEAEDVYGSPVWLNQALWSYNPVTTKSGLYDIDPNTQLLPGQPDYKLWGGHMSMENVGGQMSFSAVNLSTGWGNDNDDFVVINQKPIEVLHTDLPVRGDRNRDKNVYYFSEVVKTFAILDGKAVVLQQPAVSV